jgi:hypothetical protein
MILRCRHGCLINQQPWRCSGEHYWECRNLCIRAITARRRPRSPDTLHVVMERHYKRVRSIAEGTHNAGTPGRTTSLP